MNILFIHSVERPETHRNLLGQGHIQFGISYLSSLAQQAGHQTSLLVLNAENERHALGKAREYLQQATPDIVAYTSVSTQYPFIARLARDIRKQHPEIYQIIGGPHVSLMPEEAARDTFDAICIGEGEFAFLDLLEQLAASAHPRDIPNLWLRQTDGSMQINPSRPLLEDLDALPFPDYAMWDPWIDTREPHVPTVQIGRGCPHRCTYCSNKALRKLAEGCYVRFRSPASIIAEIQSLLPRLQQSQRSIFFETDTITANPEWTLRLCDALADFNATLSDPLRYHCNLRITPRSADNTLFAALASANIRHLNIGLESGSDRVRKNILRRNYSNDDFRQVVDLARKHDIQISIFNMIGIPGESREDHWETIELNRYAQPATSLTSIFYPYPGTELHTVCAERGLLPDSPSPSERRVAVLDLPEFPRRQVQRAYDLFDWRIHKGYRPLHVNARKLLRHYIGKSRAANRTFNALLPLWHRFH